MKIPNKLNLLFLAVIICLVIALSVRECSHQNLKQTVSAPFDSTKIFKARLNESLARGEAQILSAHKDSVRTAKELQSLQGENNRLRKQIVPVRKEVEKIADTVAIVKQFLGLTDSLDNVQEAEADTLRAEKIRTWKSFTNILSTKDEQAAIMKEIIDHLEATNKGLNKDLKRERRRKTFYKVTTALGIVTVLYLAVKD